jgi:hypothetical protein
VHTIVEPLLHIFTLLLHICIILSNSCIIVDNVPDGGTPRIGVPEPNLGVDLENVAIFD